LNLQMERRWRGVCVGQASLTNERKMRFLLRPALWIASIAIAITANVASATNTLSIDYFTIDTADPDINHLCCGTYDNMVQNNLGPNGFPVLNGAYGGPIPQDVATTGELTWWSPLLNSHVHYTSTGTVTLPFSRPGDFFPPDGTGSSDANGYQSAVLYGTLIAPTDETISFSIGADDSAFAYLDGTVVCDLGGVHPFSPGSCVTPFVIHAGAHTLQVFFDDLNAVQSGLSFTVLTEGVITAPSQPVPAPQTLALVLLALAGVGLSRRSQPRKN
jgi:hypothetical protein